MLRWDQYRNNFPFIIMPLSQFMNSLKTAIEAFEKQLADALKKVDSDQALEAVRVTFLGRNGLIIALMEQLKALSLEEKKEYGPRINTLKNWAQNQLTTIQEQIAKKAVEQQLMRTQSFDVTAAQYTPLKGSLHLYTRLIEQLEDIFITMGYQVIQGPEVETDYYNFEALNIPADHSARDLHDTFWLTLPGKLMRTHTSSVQAHGMQNNQPPLALFAPGRCYRNEAVDATHSFMFMQAEALFIDKNVSVSNLLATAKTFLQELFEKKNLTIRVRPGYFPFVEPGLEIDASCPFCKTGCSICKKTTWIELLGSGLVHPNVLRCGGVDPEKYSGFAFGFGLERLAMIKYGINDIRLFRSGKIDFLDQF